MLSSSCLLFFVATFCICLMIKMFNSLFFDNIFMRLFLFKNNKSMYTLIISTENIFREHFEMKISYQMKWLIGSTPLIYLQPLWLIKNFEVSNYLEKTLGMFSRQICWMLIKNKKTTTLNILTNWHITNPNMKNIKHFYGLVF